MDQIGPESEVLMVTPVSGHTLAGTAVDRVSVTAGDTWTETLAYVMFWGAASTITAAIILFNGQDFVDAPKLVHKEKMD